MSDPVSVSDPARERLVRLHAQRKAICVDEDEAARAETFRYVPRRERKRAMAGEPRGLSLDMEALADAMAEGRSTCSSILPDEHHRSGQRCGEKVEPPEQFCCGCRGREAERVRMQVEDGARRALRKGLHSKLLHERGRAVDLPGFPADLWSSVALHVAREWDVRRGRGLWVYGGVGAGKSAIIGGMIERLLRCGVQVCAAPAGRLLGSLARLRKSFVRSEDEYDRSIRHLAIVPVLILDDVLATALDRTELDVLLEILDARWSHAGAPIIATSNVERAKAVETHLAELARTDGVAQERVVSRLRAMTGTEIPCFYPGDRRGGGHYDEEVSEAIWPDIAAWRARLRMRPATWQDANEEQRSTP